ncbi:hypothetical protein BH23ACT6_BH23ACT6_27670 [soil metagenome]
MSLFSTIWSADRSALPRDRSVEVPKASLTEDVEAQLPLPRHLLVALAGITADAASVQDRCVDDPQLHAALGRILGRLDGLVDSIYQRSAHPAAPGVRRSGLATGSASHALPESQGESADASNDARLPTRVAR